MQNRSVEKFVTFLEDSMTTLDALRRVAWIVFLMVLIIAVAGATFVGWWLMKIHPFTSFYVMVGLTALASTVIGLFLNEVALQVERLFEHNRLNLDDLD
jgi:membrane protein YdbS with pleckstrin-like domain